MALQPPIPIDCGETTYQLSRLTQKVQDEYGLACERYAWTVLQDTRQRCDERSYAILLIEHQRMKREQEFELGQRSAATKWLDTADGLATLLQIALREFNPPLSAEQVTLVYQRHKAEFDAALNEMFGQKKTGGTAAPAGDC